MRFLPLADPVPIQMTSFKLNQRMVAAEFIERSLKIATKIAKHRERSRNLIG